MTAIRRISVDRIEAQFATTTLTDDATRIDALAAPDDGVNRRRLARRTWIVSGEVRLIASRSVARAGPQSGAASDADVS